MPTGQPDLNHRQSFLPRVLLEYVLLTTKMNRPNQSKPLLSCTNVEVNRFNHLKDDRKQITFKRSLGRFLFLLNVAAIISGNFS